MSKKTTYIVGGVGAAIVAWWLLPAALEWLVIVAIVAVPLVGYFLLDPSQRRRLKRITRKQIGR